LVSPPVADGAAAPSSPPSTTSNTITADIGGVAATVNSASLQPGVAGIYQVDLQIPSGVPAGDNILGISGPDSSAMQALISIGTGQAAPAARRAAARNWRGHSTAPARWTQPCFPGPGKSCPAR
jgi:hypothetical protein